MAAWYIPVRVIWGNAAYNAWSVSFDYGANLPTPLAQLFMALSLLTLD